MNGKNHRLEKFRLDYRSTIKTARSIKLLGDNSVGSRATGSFSFMKERREIPGTPVYWPTCNVSGQGNN